MPVEAPGAAARRGPGGDAGVGRVSERSERGGKRRELREDSPRAPATSQTSTAPPLPASLVDALSTLLAAAVVEDLRRFPDVGPAHRSKPEEDRAIMPAVQPTALHRPGGR